jgi:hypothetical protein
MSGEKTHVLDKFHFDVGLRDERFLDFIYLFDAEIFNEGKSNHQKTENGNDHHYSEIYSGIAKDHIIFSARSQKGKQLDGGKIRKSCGRLDSIDNGFFDSAWKSVCIMYM